MSQIVIENKLIGPDQPPFIIAEMSGNHKHSLERAIQIVEAAAKIGVHALKIQTYTADTITLDVEVGEFKITNSDSLWQGTSLYKLYQQAYTPWEWHEPIFKRCKELGIICFSTPFDETAVDFLEGLGVPCYKVASFENAHIPLIRKIARTGKPMIISSGMATLAELDETVRTAREEGCNQIILLKCTSTYPASPDNTNLLTIPHMREMFKCEVGLSDHTLGLGVSVAGVALGATVVEKHFTLSRAEGGVDAAFSMEPVEMQQLVLETERAWKSVGEVTYGATKQEMASLQFRRSLYIAADVQKGDVLTKDNLKVVRPGFGLPPKYYNVLLGKRVNRNLAKGTPVSWDVLD